MNVATRLHPAGFPIYTLTAGDDEVVVSAFGGQIISWTKQDVPIVFENRERAVFDGKTPYRGGAPICFPHFGRGTLLPLGTTLNPQHGHARTSIWDSAIRELDSALVLTNTQPASEGYGPTEFACQLIYSLADDLSIQASVQNIGDLAAPFQFAVHTYWATELPTKAVVKGLGKNYLDNLLGLTEHTEPDSSQPHPTPVDRVYLEADHHQELVTDKFQLHIETAGCAGAVLWNPGVDHDLKDLGSPNFICVESGVIVPGQNLDPSEKHEILIRYRARIA